MKNTIINSNGVLVSKLAQKHIQNLSQDSIAKNDLQAALNFYNNRASKEEKRLIEGAISESQPDLQEAQNKQGLNWLLKLQRSKNSPFGYRETEALESFSHFSLGGLYLNGNHAYPLYDVMTKTGFGFQYYMSGGVCNIVG